MNNAIASFYAQKPSYTNCLLRAMRPAFGLVRENVTDDDFREELIDALVAAGYAELSTRDDIADVQPEYVGKVYQLTIAGMKALVNYMQQHPNEKSARQYDPWWGWPDMADYNKAF